MRFPHPGLLRECIARLHMSLVDNIKCAAETRKHLSKQHQDIKNLDGYILKSVTEAIKPLLG